MFVNIGEVSGVEGVAVTKHGGCVIWSVGKNYTDCQGKPPAGVNHTASAIPCHCVGPHLAGALNIGFYGPLNN